MLRSPFMRTVFAALGGLFGAVTLLGILAVVNGGSGFAFCTGTTGFGWLVPLVAGLVIAIVSILLLDSGRGDEPDDGEDLRASVCASCGSPIIDDWRLCPHCGQMLECQMPVTSTMHVSNRA